MLGGAAPSVTSSLRNESKVQVRGLVAQNFLGSALEEPTSEGASVLFLCIVVISSLIIHRCKCHLKDIVFSIAGTFPSESAIDI